jgi:hypothetical protein
MSECCTSKPSDASNRESVQLASCPICHAKGKPISTRTVKSLVRDYTRSDISCDLGLRGETDIPDRVRAEIQRGFCACDVKNPSGACCLGDLTRPYSRSATILERSRVRSLLREVNRESG